MKEIIERIRDGFLEAIFPICCAGCGKEGAYVCGRCEVFLGDAPSICPTCEEPSFGERHARCDSRYGLDGLASIWEYEGIVKKMIGDIKYAGITHMAGEIIRRAFRVMANDVRFQSFLSFLLLEGVYISYVPMHKTKEKRRGFNQAKFIAQELLLQVCSKQVPHDLLKKIRETSSQTNLSREERFKNMQGSFCAESGLTQLSEKVVLVDDVWTTGATMKECCKVLKKAGVKNVWGFTLARTV